MDDEVAPLRVAVVDGDADRRERVVDTLDDEFDATVSSADEMGATIAECDVDCVVCASPAVYETVREADPNVVVALVASSLEQSTLERVVADVHADRVAPDEMLETALPVRLRRLVGLSAPAATWQLADFTDEAVVEFDLETYALLEANDRFFDAWEWNREQLVNATLSDLRQTDITHELRGRGRCQSGEEELEWIREEDAVDSLVDRAIGGRYEVREWHCQTASGDPFKSEVRVVADEANGRGYLVASVPGDGGRPRTLEYDEASMLRSLLEHIPMAVYFKDEQSRHVLLSEDVVEPFIESPEGKIMHVPEDIHMKTEFDLYPTEHAEEAVADNERVMDTGQPIRDRIERVQPPHGRELFFSTTKAPWYDGDGRIQGIVGVTMDITDRKRRERALARQQDHFGDVADCLEDVDERLAAVESSLDDGDAARTVAYASDLVAAVRAFARAGAPVQETTWVGGRDEAAAAWEAVATADVTLDQDWQYAIRGDPDRLVTLFEHLFENACEHAGDDVAVEVGTLTGDPGFYVQDDGPGVPEAVRQSLFEPGASAADGTGYGLAIVRGIATAHGWDVAAVDAADGTGGARFEVTNGPRGE